MQQSKLQILLVDDDTLHQFMAKKMIESTGLAGNVAVCSNGKEAVEYLDNIIHGPGELPDLIFLDINMPVMDGWQFLEEYEASGAALMKNTSICMVSSSVDAADVAKSGHFDSVKEYIAKPVSKDKYRQILSNVCHGNSFSPESRCKSLSLA